MAKNAGTDRHASAFRGLRFIEWFAAALRHCEGYEKHTNLNPTGIEIPIAADAIAYQ